MATIFLTGSQGQVGTEIEFELLKKGHKVVSANHSTLDITNKDFVLSAIEESQADLIINAASFTNVESLKKKLLRLITLMPLVQEISLLQLTPMTSRLSIFQLTTSLMMIRTTLIMKMTQ